MFAHSLLRNVLATPSTTTQQLYYLLQIKIYQHQGYCRLKKITEENHQSRERLLRRHNRHQHQLLSDLCITNLRLVGVPWAIQARFERSPIMSVALIHARHNYYNYSISGLSLDNHKTEWQIEVQLSTMQSIDHQMEKKKRIRRRTHFFFIK